MIHPLLRLVATQPHLLADHAEAYAGLVGEEVSQTVAGIKRRVLLSAVALGLLAIAAVLVGVALMLWAVIPRAEMQAPWALLAAPGAPALGGIICLLVGRSQPGDAFAALRQQMAADMVLLREVTGS
jgi:hypothetical protein